MAISQSFCPIIKSTGQASRHSRHLSGSIPDSPRLNKETLSSLARAFGVATDNFDSVGMYLVGVIELKVDVFDDKGPDVVAEAVGIKMSLETDQHAMLFEEAYGCETNLERQPLLDLV